VAAHSIKQKRVVSSVREAADSCGANVTLEPGASRPSTKVEVARIRDKHIPLRISNPLVFLCFAAEALSL
jgi:hypothetical protein